MSPAAATKKTDTKPTGIQIGIVESSKLDKTRTVVVRFQAKHPKYGKYMNMRSRLHVHDETNESYVGDRVEVAPCRPQSKTKTWSLVRVLDKAPRN